MCQRLRVRFHEGPDSAYSIHCTDESLSNHELQRTCSEENQDSAACLSDFEKFGPIDVWIPTPCRQHLGARIQELAQPWNDTWSSTTALDPSNNNAKCLKRDALDEQVQRHLEAFLPWRRKVLFYSYERAIKRQLATAKQRGATHRPDPLYLDVAFEIDMWSAIGFFRSRLYVRTPMERQDPAYWGIFRNPLSPPPSPPQPASSSSPSISP